MSRSCLCAFVTLNKKITYLLTYLCQTVMHAYLRQGSDNVVDTFGLGW